MRGHHECAFGSKYRLERQNHRDRAAADPAQRTQRGMNEQHRAALDAQRREISHEGLDSDGSLRAFDDVAFAHGVAIA